MYCAYIVMLLYIIVAYCSRSLILWPEFFITSHCVFAVGPNFFNGNRAKSSLASLARLMIMVIVIRC